MRLHTFIAQTLGWMLGWWLSAANATVLAPDATVGAIDGTPAATVMRLNPRGMGHVNLVPYYTTTDGFETYLNITNHDARNGKAVKVRLRSSDLGDTVFDFTLLLGPSDGWAGALSKDRATGLPRLDHGDGSCTLPADIRTVFGTARLGLPESLLPLRSQVNEGSVEIITMADIPPSASPGENPLFEAILKTPSGAKSCAAAAVARLATPLTRYDEARSAGLQVPTTGVSTLWTLIHVARAAAYSGMATALEAQAGSDGTPGFGNIVLSPQTDVPLGSTTEIRRYTTDPLLRGGVRDNRSSAGFMPPAEPVLAARRSDLPDLSTPYLRQHLPQLADGVATRLQISEINRALAVSAFASQFVVDPGVDARTDWVYGTPTRRYNPGLYVNAALEQTSNGYWFTDLSLSDTGATLPGPSANYFRWGLFRNYSGPGSPTGYQVCTDGLRLDALHLPRPGSPLSQPLTTDREGSPRALYFQFPPPLGVSDYDEFQLCGQNGVIRWTRRDYTPTDGVLGQVRNVLRLPLGPMAGWARVYSGTDNPLGLPIIGFSMTELLNRNASPSVAGNYGLAFPFVTVKP